MGRQFTGCVPSLVEYDIPIAAATASGRNGLSPESISYGISEYLM